MALRCFHFLEKRFEKNPQLKIKYCEFLNEYKELKYLSLVQNKHLVVSGFYLPHHAVMKEDSTTTKIRVVYDGSAKTSSGVSLNEPLMVGPTIQEDLFSSLTRFRSHRYALTPDIEKMYQQVLVHPDDASYQKILFRENPDENVKEYTLDTKWASNNPTLVPEDSENPLSSHMSLNPNHAIKTLGIHWNSK